MGSPARTKRFSCTLSSFVNCSRKSSPIPTVYTIAKETVLSHHRNGSTTALSDLRHGLRLFQSLGVLFPLKVLRYRITVSLKTSGGHRLTLFKHTDSALLLYRPSPGCPRPGRKAMTVVLASSSYIIRIYRRMQLNQRISWLWMTVSDFTVFNENLLTPGSEPLLIHGWPVIPLRFLQSA